MRAPLVSVAAALASLVPAVAGAQPTICEVRDVDPAMGSADLFCAAPASCATADDCATSGFSEPVCGTALSDLPRVCRPHCGTLVGCTVDGDCRPFRMEGGVCLRSSSGTATTGICAYRGLGVTYCTDGGETAVDMLRFAHCHLRPDGSATSDYFEGDCDQDLCANGADPTPCIADDAECGTLDLTIACSNAEPDAGVTVRDGGTTLPDAGTTSFDAGAPLDAPPDPGIDANRVTGVSFGGGGGVRCTCRVGRSPATAPAWLLAGLGLATACRRRRLERRR